MGRFWQPGYDLRGWRLRLGRRSDGLRLGRDARPTLRSTLLAAATVSTLVAGLLGDRAGPRRRGSGGSTPVVRRAPPGRIDHIFVIDLENEGFATTFGPGSPATYLNGTLRRRGELLVHYYGIGHFSLDNYIAQVSGQSPTNHTRAMHRGVRRRHPRHSGGPGPGRRQRLRVPGPGAHHRQPARHPLSAQPPDHVAAWRAYEQDMGNDPAHDGGVPDPTGGTTCGHPAIGGSTAIVATADDQYATRHNPFVWFHSVIDDAAECQANVVPLGTLGPSGVPSPDGPLALDLAGIGAAPRFRLHRPNLCDDGHDGSAWAPTAWAPMWRAGGRRPVPAPLDAAALHAPA